MINLIDGKGIAAELRAKCAERASNLISNGIVPKLAVIIVGDDPASHQYVNSRAADCKAVGMDSTVYELPSDTTQSELISLLEQINVDPKIHGILLQMPLPMHMNPDEVVVHISRDKDVDGLHPINIGMLGSGKPSFAPCTPSSIMQLIKSTGVPIRGKNAVVVGRSNVVGKPAAMLLLQENATVTICHSKTVDLKEHTMQADILVAAVGVPGLITGDMIKPGAIVIDAGINRVDGKTVGDVDFESAKEVAGAITPVPGGVGPVTRTILLMHTLDAAERINAGN